MVSYTKGIKLIKSMRNVKNVIIHVTQYIFSETLKIGLVVMMILMNLFKKTSSQ
jgi:hypothetical protein